MDLKNLAAEFAKAIAPKEKKTGETTLFGTVVASGEDLFVRIDGSDQLTPASSTIELAEGQRVTVTIKNHEAVVTGSVDDQAITRSGIDVFARNGIFSGTLSAATGSFSGTVTASSGTIGGWSLTDSAIYRTNSTFGNASGMYFGTDGLSISNRFTVNPAGQIKLYVQDNLAEDARPSLQIFTNRFGQTAMNFNLFTVTRSSETLAPRIESSASVIEIWPEIYSPYGITSNGRIYADGGITLSNNLALRAKKSDDSESNLIYLNPSDVVVINGGYYKTKATTIGTSATISGTLTTSGHIYSGGSLMANNCTAWNAGIAGGFIKIDGMACLVSDSSSTYPRITFVKNKSTSAYTQLRANNTGSTSYTLTLPNSNGTLAVSSSDIRLKENLKKTEVKALDIIKAINLYSFDWKPEGREGAPHWDIGMIADEIEKLDKNLVNGGGYFEDGTINAKTIDTLYLLGYVVKAIQELTKEVHNGK